MKIHKRPFESMIEVGDLDRYRNLDRLDACPHKVKNLDDGKNKKIGEFKLYTK